MTTPKDSPMPDQPERFDLRSADIAADRREELLNLFPDVRTEDGKIDFDALKRSLGETVDTGPERFGLTWPGKAECMRVVQQPSIGTLVPMREESVDFDTTQNVIIEGDNLEVLKLLQKAYYGKVKLIYIDPPYNTGKDFIYPDNFREGLADYLRYSGQVDGQGLKLAANGETDGRYHSRWLSMIYPRLFLARNLLRDDGLVMISIDDHEFPRLLLILDEIFGSENHIGTVVWKNATDNNPTRIAVEHEYLVCYARDKTIGDPEWKSRDSASRDLLIRIGNELIANHTPGAELQKAYTLWFRENRQFLGVLDRYRYIDHDGVYTGSQSVHNPGKEGYRYDVIHPRTGLACKQPLLGYRFPEETMRTLVGNGRIIFGEDESKIVELKVYARDYKQKFGSVVDLDGRLGANELRTLFSESTKVFTNPKPVALLRDLMSFVCDDTDIVADFFAGSGAMGDAVLSMNAELGGDRRFILVQLPEPTDDNAFGTIAGVARERVRRAGARLLASPPTSEGGPLDIGFRSYRLAASGFRDWSGDAEAAGAAVDLRLISDHVDPAAGDGSLLAELLLKSGFELTVPVDHLVLVGKSVHAVSDGLLLVCLDRQLSVELFEAMVELEPERIIVLDAGFGGSDELKVNAVQTIRAHNQRTERPIDFRVV